MSVRLHASRPDPMDSYSPALSAFHSAKQAVVAEIVRARSWTGMALREERDDRLVEIVVEGEAEHVVNLLLTLRYLGVGCLHASADSEAELALLHEEFGELGERYAGLETELSEP